MGNRMKWLFSFLSRAALVAALLVSGGELAGAQGTYPGTQQPWFLTSNITVFVDGLNGNDNNSGLASGTGNAWATFAPAYKFLCYRTNGNGFAATIQVANASSIAGAGGIGGAFVLNCTPQGYPFVILDLGGGTLTPGSGFDAVQLANSMYGSGFITSALHVRNGTITCSGGGSGLHSISGHIVITNTGGALTFGTCTGGPHIFADGPTARFFINGGYTISGSAAEHLAAVAGGGIDFNTTATITCSGSPAFTNFVLAQWLSWIYTPTSAITFSSCGTVTGTRYTGNLNSVINTNGGGANFFPGNAAGSTTTGSQYN